LEKLADLDYDKSFIDTILGAVLLLKFGIKRGLPDEAGTFRMIFGWMLMGDLSENENR